MTLSSSRMARIVSGFVEIPVIPRLWDNMGIMSGLWINSITPSQDNRMSTSSGIMGMSSLNPGTAEYYTKIRIIDHDIPQSRDIRNFHQCCGLLYPGWYNTLRPGTRECYWYYVRIYDKLYYTMMKRVFYQVHHNRS